VTFGILSYGRVSWVLGISMVLDLFLVLGISMVLDFFLVLGISMVLDFFLVLGISLILDSPLVPNDHLGVCAGIGLPIIDTISSESSIFDEALRAFCVQLSG
jgi:hypothetical protein